MHLHHLVLSTLQREPLLLEPVARRAAVRTLARIGGPRLLLFAYADDHLHAVVDGDRPGAVGGAVARGLHALSSARLQPCWSEPVADRAHLRRLVTYVLRQPEHHGLGHPARWEGSCFLDLVGARILDGFDPAAWRAWLPREGLGLVWEAVRIAAPTGVSIAGRSLDALIAAAARAFAADPALRGNLPPVTRARHAAAALAVEAGFRSSQIAESLAISLRGVQRLCASACADDDVRAVRRSLAVAEQAG